MAIYVSGSLAFDRIMTFGGNLQDHVLMDKLHMLSVSFMVDSMDERRGGCAGNIAYTLALLGEKPIVVSAAGRDFTGYAAAWEKLGLSLEGIRRDSDVFTALCYITTDQNNNQITGFYPGAMSQPATYTFPNLDPAKDWAIVSPGSVDDMRRLPGFFREKGVRYIFDPGQQLPVLSGDDLCDAIRGSYACVTNDYELGMVCKKTGKSEEELVAMTGWLVTTLGGDGQRIRNAQGVDVHVPAIPCDGVKDPTGAGDSHRAGLLKGLVCGLEMPEAAKLGAVSACYAIEQLGTQEHLFSKHTGGACPAGPFFHPRPDGEIPPPACCHHRQQRSMFQPRSIQPCAPKPSGPNWPPTVWATATASSPSPAPPWRWRPKPCTARRAVSPRRCPSSPPPVPCWWWPWDWPVWTTASSRICSTKRPASSPWRTWSASPAIPRAGSAPLPCRKGCACSWTRASSAMTWSTLPPVRPTTPCS